MEIFSINIINCLNVGAHKLITPKETWVLTKDMRSSWKSLNSFEVPIVMPNLNITLVPMVQNVWDTYDRLVYAEKKYPIDKTTHCNVKSKNLSYITTFNETVVTTISSSYNRLESIENHKVSGEVSKNCRIFVINEDTLTLEKTKAVTTGGYVLVGLSSGKKLVVARSEDNGQSAAFGNVDSIM